MEKLCALSRAVGNDEECPRAWCAFWERGRAAIELGCAIERLGLDLGNPDLARHLLELRRALDDKRSAEEADRARGEIGEVVPPDLSGA